MALIAIGLGCGGYIIYLWQTSSLDPNRPIMTLMVIFLLTGMQVLLFGFIGALLVIVRREIFRVQRRQGEMLLHLHQLEQRTTPGEFQEQPKREKVHAGD
jgi:hypothetical protein